MPRTSRCKRSIFRGQGAQGAESRPRIHELRLHDLARSRQRRSGMADNRSAQCAQHRPCRRTAALRCRAYYQRERWSRRSSRLLCLGWTTPVAAIADDFGSIRALVRREHTLGSDWIKTTNTGSYFSPGDDPARVMLVRRRDGSADFDRPSAWHVCCRSHRRRREMQAGHPLWRAQP